jgi:hypothetical protein
MKKMWQIVAGVWLKMRSLDPKPLFVLLFLIGGESVAKVYCVFACIE